jgi:hypothetical protein
MRREFRVDPIAIDVNLVLQHSIASLYSHLGPGQPEGQCVWRLRRRWPRAAGRLCR